MSQDLKPVRIAVHYDNSPFQLVGLSIASLRRSTMRSDAS
jgi:hypothetical protein